MRIHSEHAEHPSSACYSFSRLIDYIKDQPSIFRQIQTEPSAQAMILSTSPPWSTTPSWRRHTYRTPRLLIAVRFAEIPSPRCLATITNSGQLLLLSRLLRSACSGTLHINTASTRIPCSIGAHAETIDILFPRTCSFFLPATAFLAAAGTPASCPQSTKNHGASYTAHPETNAGLGQNTLDFIHST